MKRNNAVLSALLLLLIVRSILPIGSAFAQESIDSTAIWFVETFDGNEYFGNIVERTGALVRIETRTLGTISIPSHEIKNIYEITEDRIKNGQFWSDNPQATRYFWAPNGFGLKPKEGYYQNVWVFFNHFGVGVTENFSVGAGFVPAFLFGGSPTPVWITPKISLPVPGTDNKFNLGAGVLAGTVIGGEASSAPFGLAYGVATIGTRDSNINFGMGMGFAEGQWAEQPMLTVSAMVRTGRRGYIISENYLIPDGSFGLISLGGRLVGKQLSFDYGLMAPVEDGQIYFALPWLGVAVPLGN